ncbi:DUF1304 domain-containing protein [Estrella lausannensis]|uniref:Conserved putative membrane protein n=1 Tax=Estrella lausannensis TaxID=483423 RepID=A0A0H5DPR6_9BACT|nr:DUF1304 domain-containing protein [Estrella lausannensis]CRX38462.1 Conserved putative membrane protein [Estrella lausannensis]
MMHEFWVVASFLLTAFVALLHCYILVLEMFLWETPFGRAVFRMSKENAAVTAVLAKNQGLYNGFLAAGLFWSLLSSDPLFQVYLKVFFLSCVLIAGFFGAITAKKEILYYQAVPAAVALAVLYLSLL